MIAEIRQHVGDLLARWTREREIGFEGLVARAARGEPVDPQQLAKAMLESGKTLDDFDAAAKQAAGLLACRRTIAASDAATPDHEALAADSAA